MDGGSIKPSNVKTHHRDRRLTRNQGGKRKVVVVVRERGGNSVPAVSIWKVKLLHSFAHVSRGNGCACRRSGIMG